MLTEQSICNLLSLVAKRERTVEEAFAELRSLPYEDLEFARIDHHRALRRGCGEIIYCAGKTPAQTAAIAATLARHHGRLLGTRAGPEHFQAVKQAVPEVEYDATAGAFWLAPPGDAPRQTGVTLLAAGTSDLPVAQEALVTLHFLGCHVEKIIDAGVAGLHRLLDHLPAIRAARVVVVVAGMDGALPSVVAGLIRAPVIAVPTSVGYGASFGGVAALLTMLNSCAPGIAVVNIDNGFGAAYLAASILDCRGCSERGSGNE